MGKAFIDGLWFKISWPFERMHYNNWSKIMLEREGHFYILSQLTEKSGEVVS